MRLAKLDPVVVRVLEIDLADAIGAKPHLAGLAGRVDVGDSLPFEIAQGPVEGRRREAKMGRARTRRRRLVRPGNEMDRAMAVYREPTDRRTPRLILDLLEPYRLEVEAGARRKVSHGERDMVHSKIEFHGRDRKSVV